MIFAPQAWIRTFLLMSLPLIQWCNCDFSIDPKVHLHGRDHQKSYTNPVKVFGWQ